MGMGILDLLDNPSVLSNLLGIGGADSQPQAQSPMPPPGAPGTVAPGGMPPGIGPQGPMPPMPPPQMPMPRPDPRGLAPGQFDDRFDATAVPGSNGQDEAGMAQAPQLAPGIPLPQPAPGGMSEVNKNMPMPRPDPRGLTPDQLNDRFDAVAGPGTGGVDEAGMIAAHGPPTDVSGQRKVPLPPPGGPVQRGGPQPQTSTGLGEAFGLNRSPENQRADQLRAVLNGVGKGLSAVGKAPAGTTAGASFATGLGGSLEGITGAQEQQKDTLFKQTDQAFRSMMAAKTLDSREKYQGQYLAMKKQALDRMIAQGKVNAAYQNSPEYKVLKVEQMAEAHRKEELKGLREQFKGDPDGFAKAKAELNTEIQQYRDDLYRKSGIDPAGAEKIKTLGQPGNPFVVKGMTPAEFEARVPKDGYYINPKDGKTYQRLSSPEYDRTQPADPNAMAGLTSDREDRQALLSEPATAADDDAA